ncbi:MULTISPECIES: M23 family metallopeptidase [Streptomyces]|uniref:Peptidoglycan DD-metalloendopeptidase family protein n=1 Tax=Streptomyces fuscus TaxID=3048495 RepID=A0ABT7J6D3_9ACTN|nr:MULTISPECIES: M23 family metallopeptidase [Streptomyces]MCM1970934.1 peptidoglycan DD-metalloendopeptidase family protein [Streptomyces sp. G1]MDL2080436.1 peptidoglycan DD-metalloendopeptidase family protein [Streptomyces fuscus]
MRSLRRHPLLVPVLLCACAVLAARPATTNDTSDTAGTAAADGDSVLSAKVTRLYEEAAVATRHYEAGRREADEQRAKAESLEALLDRQRAEVAVLREDLGRIARAQYRDGGGMPVTAQIILADSPEELMRGQHVFSRTNLAVNNAVEKNRRAEARLTADEEKAKEAWRDLDRRSTELASLKQDIEAKLEEAREELQGRAEASVAAGACRGAVRLDQPETHFASRWVAPVETYELSASYGSGGDRWARRHTGQDFAVPIGTPVRAVGEGRVVRVSCGGPFGIEIVLQHPNGYYTQYAHLAAVAVDQGERVGTGQWIGQSGSTGNSTGPHLHFEVRVTPESGSALDPEAWLASREVNLG